MTTSKPVHALIVDTGPLIKNTISISTIIAQADEIYTTSAVLSEIRDPVTRSRVETTLLPFLKIRNPSPASYEHVAQFSKKTGDFPVLSRQDLGILALAYELNVEKEGGDWRLRKVPGQKELNGKPPGQEKEKAEGNAEVDEKKSSVEEEIVKEASLETTQDAPTDGESENATVLSSIPTEESTASDDVSGSLISSEDATALDVASDPTSQPTETPPTTDSIAEDFSDLQIVSDQQPSAEKASSPPQAAPSDEDDSDGEWITPSNITKHQAKDSGNKPHTTEPIHLSVATMTTDFAMQNVLLQMNLHLISPSMQRIRNLRTYILRCHACFFTTKLMDKQFCPRCGQPTLTRVSCSTNAKGEFQIHLSKNFQWNNRGNRFSVPKPVGGTPNGKYRNQGGGRGAGARNWY